MNNIDINSQFEEAIDIIENSNNHLLLTGRAGTGKSTLLNHIRQTTKKNYAVVAPTGIAAVNIEGETIHSFFKFRINSSKEDIQKNAKQIRNKELYTALQLLIIDEISMVRADLMDYIDIFLRTVRKNEEVFGGVQIVFVGDLFQLPPVLKNDESQDFLYEYETPYFFSSVVFRQIIKDISFIELEQIYRQNDIEFIEILNAIRNASVTQEQLDFINEQCLNKPINSTKIIYLASTNYIADDLNKRYLARLTNPSKKIQGKIAGSFNESNLPTEQLLELKSGARVMFLNNDPDKRWVNGTLGTVISFVIQNFGDVDVKVKIDDGEEVLVENFTWKSFKSTYNQQKGTIEREETGSFRQMPLKLAWAITIHKSQGKTFDTAMIDLGKGAFAAGQTYVALSRCRSLDGIVLKKELTMRDIIVDQNIVEFYRRVGN